MLKYNFCCSKRGRKRSIQSPLPPELLINKHDAHYDLSERIQKMDTKCIRSLSELSSEFQEILLAFFDHLNELGDTEIEVAYGSWISVSDKVWILIGRNSRHWIAFDPKLMAVLHAIPSNIKQLKARNRTCSVSSSQFDARDLMLF